MVRYWRPAHKKNKGGKWLGITCLLLFALVLLFAYHNIRIYRYRSDYAEKAEELQAEVKALETEEAQLEFQMETMGQEAFLEQIAHERLNLKKPEEQVVVFETKLEEPAEDEINPSFWTQIKEKIMSFFIKRQ